MALVLGPYSHGGTYLLIMTKNICLFLRNYHIRRHMCLILSPIDLNLAGHQKHIHNYVSARLFTLSFIGVSDCLPTLLGGDNSSLG